MDDTATIGIEKHDFLTRINFRSLMCHGENSDSFTYSKSIPKNRLHVFQPMVGLMMKQFIIFIFVGVCCIFIAQASPTLDEFRWKKRILVIPNAQEKILAKLKFHEKEILERDIVIVELTAGRQGTLERQIREKFRVGEDDKKVLLIGKDGKTSVFWDLADFSIEALFGRIDAMPMRRREMREREETNS